MSIPVPTEILLDILSRVDRETLRSLRRVNKQLCQISTEVLFHDLNIHYGFDRSIAQMRAIIDAPAPVSGLPVRLCVKTLTLPSESFFPYAHTFRLDPPYIFQWSYGLPAGHPLLNPENGNPGYGAYAEQQAVRTGELAEEPGDTELIFDLGVMQFLDQYELYLETIVKFLEACENLQQIRIPIGLGWSTQRMKHWVYMITNNALPVIASRIQKMSVMIPQVQRSYIPIFSEHLFNSQEEGRRKVFSSLTLLNITFHSVECCRSAPENEKIIKNQIGKFIFSVPNLNSFKISNVRLSGTPGPQIFSQLPGKTTIVNLSLCMIYFGPTHSSPAFDDFQAMIVSMPYLRHLELRYIVFHHANTGRAAKRTFDPRTNLLRPTSERLPSHIFTELPLMSWTNILALLQRSLPNLKSYRFGRLMYGRHRRNDTTQGRLRVMLVAPMDGKYEMLTFESFFKQTRGEQMISPYRRDHLELEAFKREISRRRRNIGLGGGGSANSYPIEEDEAENSARALGQQDNLMWRFL